MRKFRIYNLGLAFAATMAMFAVSCSDDNPGDNPEGNPSDEVAVKTEIVKPEKNDHYKSISLTAEQKQTAGTLNDFAVRFYKEVFNAGDENFANSNQVVSPLSLDFALAMLSNGAYGQTLEEILKTMSGDGKMLTVNDLNEWSAAIITGLYSADQTCSFNIANGVWFDPQLYVRGSYLNAIRQPYWAEWQEMDFKDTQSVLASINGWAARETDGMIRDIKKTVGEEENMILANALAFSGEWDDPYRFDEENTAKGEFTTATGNTVIADMMSTSISDAFYADNDLFEATKVYLGNKSYELVLILPKQGVSLRDVRDNFSLDMLKRASDSKYVIKVKLPRFDIPQKEYNLNDVLANMGIVTAFDRKKADFSLLSMLAKPSINDIIQFATIGVDEKGVKAAAVTMIEMAGWGGPTGNQPIFVDMTFDRPFMYMLRASSTGSILFMGQVTNPTKK